MVFQQPLIILSFVISFLVALVGTFFWIKKMKERDFLWEDMNKPGYPREVPGSGGMVVILGFLLGVLYYVAIRSFIFNVNDGISVKIFALLNVLLILALVGLVDDFFQIKKAFGGTVHVEGLSTRFRIIAALLAAIPLIVINAGVSTLAIPFLGNVNFGGVYPLILIPIGIAGSTIVYNFLAGFDGLEAGQGILILGFLSYIAYSSGNSWLAIVGLSMVASLFGFWLFNKFPTTILPGDSLTWGVGALIACMAILGNFEKIALIVFIPYIIEFYLKAIRGKFKYYSFGLPNEDGSLEVPYEKIYGLTHFAIFCLKKIKPSKKVYKQDVVWFIHGIQLIFILIAWAVFL